MNSPVLSEQETQARTVKSSLFESDVKQRVKEMGLDYDTLLAFAQPEWQAMQLIFTPQQEPQLDGLIRYVRNHLSSNFVGRNLDFINGPYPVAAFKHFIHHAHEWSLTFCFSERWECHETIPFDHKTLA